MFIAPLNYDRFFRKIFSDLNIAKRFLEDILDIKIQQITPLKGKNVLTDDAQAVEFDFRCKVNGAYIIIDMQQWYKQDIAHRFYLYHCLNSGLQLEDIPKKALKLNKGKVIKEVKDYRLLEPVITLIWMADDNIGFDKDYIVYKMLLEDLEVFIKNDNLWNNNELKMLMKEREKLLIDLNNRKKSIDFIGKNKLIFAFQKNIVKNNNLNNYKKWFRFASISKNKNNKEKDFDEFKNDKIFIEIIRRLRKDNLTDSDIKYITEEEQYIKELERWEETHYDYGFNDGVDQGIEQGIEQGETRKSIVIAKNLLDAGSEISLISKVTGLSINKLKEVLNIKAPTAKR